METPRITQVRLNQYRQELENSAKDASDFVRSIVEAYQIAYPEASIADIKKYTCDAIEDALHVFGGQSCTVANELFEELASQAGESVDTQIYDTFDRTYAESKVGYFAKDIVNGNIATFNGSVGALTGFYVKREAFQNMLNNCSKNGVRYARVPSGKETCAFCFMLASRGFVYHTKQSAGEGFGHSYHRHCDCIIVPGFHEGTGISADAQIEGYKPSKLYERYKSCLDAVQTPQHTWDTDAFNADVRAGKIGANEWEKWKLKRLCAEIGSRDTKWLWTGAKPEIDDEEKPIEQLTKSEKTALYTLKRNGIQVKTKAEDPKAVKNIDFEIDGQLWEHKNVTTLSSLSNQLTRSRIKFYALKLRPMNHILTLNDSTVSTADMYEKIKGKLKDDEEVLVIRDGKLLRIKK